MRLKLFIWSTFAVGVVLGIFGNALYQQAATACGLA